jgi:hypothetical protein
VGISRGAHAVAWACSGSGAFGNVLAALLFLDHRPASVWHVTHVGAAGYALAKEMGSTVGGGLASHIQMGSRQDGRRQQNEV